MKTNCIISKVGSLVPITIAAVLLLSCLSCEEGVNEYKLPYGDFRPDDDGIVTESFTVGEQGAYLALMGGTVFLEFPPGALTGEISFIITSSPMNVMDTNGRNLANNLISLESEVYGLQFQEPVRMSITYCCSQFESETQVNEDNLTIFLVSPQKNDASMYTSIGQCTVNCPGKTVHGDIAHCGYYVVGEN